MLRNLATALILTLASTVSAAQSTVPNPHIRWGNALLRVGDSEGRVMQVTKRPPDRIVQLENRFGGAVGERWVYYDQNGANPRTVSFVLSGGKVVGTAYTLDR